MNGTVLNLFVDGNAIANTLANPFAGDWTWLVIAIVLILVAVLIIGFIRNVLINSAIGLALWGILVFVFQVPLAFWPSLIASALLGPAGIGIILVSHFLGFSW